MPPGIGRANPHIYSARLGLFDVDYLGHMNNGEFIHTEYNDFDPRFSNIFSLGRNSQCAECTAAYLSHAEYARWEMCAENGLIEVMAREKSHFVVAGSAIRYRKEMRPIFARFAIESSICGLDDRIIWIQHNFRSTKSPRIVAQVLVQGAVVRERQTVSPIDFFKNKLDLDGSVVDEMITCDEAVALQLRDYAALDNSMRTYASIDDKIHTS